MRQQASYTTASTDPVSLTHELVAGLDVAAAQQIDSTWTDTPVVPFLAETRPCNDGGSNQDEVPISYSLVTDHLDASTSNEQERKMSFYFRPSAKVLMLNRNLNTAIGPLMDLPMRLMMAISFFAPRFLGCSF